MKKVSFANICACASLFISLVLICLWYSNVKGFTVVTLDTFVGVIISLLAIIVTLAIIWQIYNAIDMRNKIEELKLLEVELDNQKKLFGQFLFSASVDVYSLNGIVALRDNLLLPAFRYFLYSLNASMQLDKPINIDVLLSGIEGINKTAKEKVIDEANQLESIKDTHNKIQSLPNYELIKGRYEPIYNEFLSKVKKDEKKQ